VTKKKESKERKGEREKIWTVRHICKQRQRE
jgi:hypothetical protein